jgi:peptide/nickel transport system substrate-binding protein
MGKGGIRMARFPGSVLGWLAAGGLLLASFAAAAGPAAFAAPAQAAALTPQHGGALTLASTQEVISFDPVVATDDGSIWAMLLIYEQLVRPNTAGTGVSPDLAESWTVSNAGKTYTFHLRPGVKFTNGMPVTSSDVAWSLNRAFTSANWSFLFPGKTTILTPTPETVVFKLSTPDTAFLAKLALYACSILPEQVYKGAPESAFAKPIGSGPFALQSWQQGKQVVLVANKQYWDKPYPYLSKVTLETVPDTNTLDLLARTGQASVVENIPNIDLLALEHLPTVTVKTYKVGAVAFMLMNTKRTPFNNLDVRLAMNYAINREAVIKTVLSGIATRANTYLPPMLYHCPVSVCKGYDINLALAKKYMAKSSDPHGFTTTLQIEGGNETDEETATIIQSELATIGITAKIQQVDIATLLTDNSKGDYDMELLGNTTDIIDPSEQTGFEAVGDGGDYSNDTFWNSSELDKLATQVNEITSNAKRQADYYEMQNLFNQGAPYVCLYYPLATAVYQSYVHGFTLLETSNYQLWKVWLSPH